MSGKIRPIRIHNGRNYERDRRFVGSLLAIGAPQEEMVYFSRATIHFHHVCVPCDIPRVALRNVRIPGNVGNRGFPSLARDPVRVEDSMLRLLNSEARPNLRRGPEPRILYRIANLNPTRGRVRRIIQAGFPHRTGSVRFAAID